MVGIVCSAVLLMNGCTTQHQRVAYTVYPIGYLLQYLGGTTFDTISIQDDTYVQNAKIATDYKTILKDSDVLMYIGDLEPYLAVTMDEISKEEVSTLDLSLMNAIYDFKRYTGEMTSQGVLYVESNWYDSSAFDYVDMYEKDVSIWIDPIAMLSMGRSIYQWLCTNYSDNTDYYTERYTQLEKDLINLDAQYQTFASSLQSEGKTIRLVTMTPSFGNWQKAYGFEIYPVMLSKFGELPNEEQIAEIEKRILEDGVEYIVYEPTMDEALYSLYERIQTDCNLESVTVSSLSNLTQEQDLEGKDYISIMYENLSALQQIHSENLMESEDAENVEEQ